MIVIFKRGQAIDESCVRRQIVVVALPETDQPMARDIEGRYSPSQTSCHVMKQWKQPCWNHKVLRVFEALG